MIATYYMEIKSISITLSGKFVQLTSNYILEICDRHHSIEGAILL
jgi:hypothetical protein